MSSSRRGFVLVDAHGYSAFSKFTFILMSMDAKYGELLWCNQQRAPDVVKLWDLMGRFYM